MKKIAISIVVAIVGAFLAFTIVFAGETCEDGNGWTKINSGDLSQYPVAGATEYCFKAGNWTPVNEIPAGGFGQDGSCNNGVQFCDLSHWSYKDPCEGEECESPPDCEGDECDPPPTCEELQNCPPPPPVVTQTPPVTQPNWCVRTLGKGWASDPHIKSCWGLAAGGDLAVIYATLGINPASFHPGR